MSQQWTDEKLLDVVGQIYEAAADPDKLAAVVDVVQKAMDIGSALLFVSDHRSGDLIKLLGTSANFDPQARSDYRLHYHNQNPWYQNAKNKNGLFVRHGGELIEAGEFEKTEFRADWCKRVGIYHFLGGTAPVRGNLAVAVGLHKSFGSDGFSEEDKRVFSILLQHLVRACQLADKIGTLVGREAQTFELLSKLNVGFILVDKSCRPLHVNGLADKLLRSSRWLTYSNGRVRPIYPALQPAFEQRVGKAASLDMSDQLIPGGVIALLDPIERPLAVSIIPFMSTGLGLGTEQSAVAILFSDPDAKLKPTAGDIAALFDFTPAEAKLVAQLVEGRSMVDAAQSIGISPNTAKSQLQSVFLKTGCNKQSELVSMIVSNPLARLVSAGS